MAGSIIGPGELSFVSEMVQVAYFYILIFTDFIYVLGIRF